MSLAPDSGEPATPPAEPSNPFLKTAVAQLGEYFRGERRRFEVPFAPESGTAFQRAAWKAAGEIPCGQTRSYWWVAVRAGNPYAVRAVGGAMGANPLPIFVPCHRVIRSDGSLGGFSSDPELKPLLLAHEAPELFGEEPAPEEPSAASPDGLR